eukprot:7332274-Pyramimonas_sp.AAC.1
MSECSAAQHGRVRVVAYNPNSATLSRAQDIIEELANHTVVTLIGAQEKQYQGQREMRKFSSFWGYTEGWKAGTMTNKSCGISI